MKLISVQSRGNRIARVIKTRTHCEVYGKTLSYWPDTGFSISLVFRSSLIQREYDALKCAESWLKGANT